MALTVVIVGSGPAGFYAAEALARKAAGASIDILDRLPTPYGLVRAGVAPDHQGNKAVTRVFERVATRPGVRFLGDVEVGRDVSVAELAGLYDAVILAVGATQDRCLGIPGDDKAGVLGSFRFVGWYNGHPDFADRDFDLQAESVAVIGNGNVAIDVARVLAKTPAEMAAADICPHAAARIAAAPIRDIHVFGRRGPVEANFTNPELAELLRLEGAVALADPADLPADIGAVDEKARKTKEANLATLRAFAANAPEAKPKRIRFHFHRAPRAVLGTTRVEGLRLERTRAHANDPAGMGGTVDVPCGLVITCIGYRCHPLPGVPMDEARGIVASVDGRVAQGLYAVGWAKRGPSGTIPTNRADSAAVVDLLLADLGSGADRPGPAGLDRMLAERRLHPVTFDDWKRIDAAETTAARAPAPRLKLTRRADLLAAAQGG